MVAAAEVGERLDRVLHRSLSHLSRSRIRALIDAGAVLVDGSRRKAASHVRRGEAITVVMPPPEPAALVPEAIPLRVLYEDDDLLIVDKPAGMAVHPAPGHDRGTLVHALLARASALSGVGGTLRPGIVHRLDKDTSGLLIVAKHDAAHASLAAQIASRSARRRYVAIVRGDVRPDEGAITLPVGRHPVNRKKMAVVPAGRPAVTRYRVRERFGTHTLVEAELQTGRTHQIRVHFAHLGHPVAGDPLYGAKGDLGLPRQALHAWRLEFSHPSSGERLIFDSPVPPDIAAALERLRAGTRDPGLGRGR